MEDPRHFGAVLADTTIARMEAEALSGEEAAIFAATEIVRRADAMVEAGETRQAAETWSGVVILTYGARLDELITAREKVIDVRKEYPR